MCVHLRRCVCICGYSLPPRLLRIINILEIHQRKCVCACRLQSTFLSTLSSYPTLPLDLKAVLFNELFKSICSHMICDLPYTVYNQALAHAKFLWSTHHPTSFTHASAFFYLFHSLFSISISILSQEAIHFSHVLLQKRK